VDPLSILPEDYVNLALMGLVVQPLSFALIALGPRYLPAPEVGLIMLLETLLGPIWVWWFQAELPPANTLLGGAVVLTALIGNALLGLRSSKR
jgi:drug/metabolite transporter (DMT)-like permease